MDKEEGGEQNMISNLPLLFASGYPTSLDKISETQLENFIPFMVQCSLGHINTQGKIKCGEPEWWPEDVPYVSPFTKPRKFTGNWMDKMKEIVIICYQFHKSVFLLKFCNDLASYEHASLRFINNYNSTTSLFDRRNNKLLVTFRNENMSYDQPLRGRKCLLKQKKNDRTNEGEMEQMMVEPAPFDIYLCDNCDAELYSKEAILEHEKTCNVDTDDVILCDSPEPEHQTITDQGVNSTMQSPDEKEEMRNMFLLNFNLQSVAKTSVTPLSGKQATPSKLMNEDDIIDNALKRRRRLTRRSRAVHSLTRCPTIPLSSPAGMLLLRTNAPGTTNEYITERLERVERFCHAPALNRGIPKPKYMEKRYVPNVTNITYKKPAEHSSHIYTFPRRQFAQRRRAEEVTLALLRRCRPISVRLKKLSPDQEVKRSNAAKRHTIANTNGISSSNLNIKLKRDTGRSFSWKISKPAGEIIVDTIDLCSSDEEKDMVQKKGANKSLTNATFLESFKKAVLNKNADEKLQIKMRDITITPSVSQKKITIESHEMRMRRYTDGNRRTEEAQLSTIFTAKRPSAAAASALSSTTTEINNTIMQARQAKSTSNSNCSSNSVYLLPYYKNTNTSTSTSSLFNTNNYDKPTMLTDTLPLSNSGHNRQNNHNLLNNSSNNLLLSNQAIKTTAALLKKISTATTTTIAVANTANTITKDVINSVPPAQWLGSAALNNNNNKITINNNNNKFIINNNQILTENTIILDPIVPSATTATAVGGGGGAAADNHHVDTRTSPNLNHLQKRVIIDLTH